MNLLQGILIGFLYALVPGGTIVMGVHLAIDRGFARSVSFTYGVLAVDVGYGMLAVAAADAATGYWERALLSWPLLLPALQLLLVTALLSYGGLLLFRGSATVDTPPGAGPARTGRVGRFSPLLIGVGLKLTTATSPSFLAGVALLTAEARSLGLPGWDSADRFLFALGYGIGNFVFLQAAMRFAARSTDGARGRTLLLLRRGTGTAFAALGILLLLQVIVSG